MNPPKPFLKWAGGKRQIVPAIRQLMPEKFDRYHELFLGGGALYWDIVPELAAANALDPKRGRVVLSDANEELVMTYRAISNHFEETAVALKTLADAHSPESYLAVRASRPQGLPAIAARMIYLNRTCFNGVYRVNKQGKFNVPMDRTRTKAEIDFENLRACSDHLPYAIYRHDFEVAAEDALPGDFVYLDPPYVPLTKTSSFTAFTKDGFTDADHCRLAQCFERLSERGVYCILSNSDTPMVRELYSRFAITEVSRRGTMSSKGEERGRVGELLIRGF